MKNVKDITPKLIDTNAHLRKLNEAIVGNVYQWREQKHHKLFDVRVSELSYSDFSNDIFVELVDIYGYCFSTCLSQFIANLSNNLPSRHAREIKYWKPEHTNPSVKSPF